MQRTPSLLLRSSLIYEGRRPEKISNLESSTEVRKSLIYLPEFLVNEPGLEFKEEIVFEDGTVYKG
jgi:hypothetical protein